MLINGSLCYLIFNTVIEQHIWTMIMEYTTLCKNKLQVASP